MKTLIDILFWVPIVGLILGIIRLKYVIEYFEEWIVLFVILQLFSYPILCAALYHQLFIRPIPFWPR